MKRFAWTASISWMCVAIAMAQELPLSTTGITVGAPKVYDNYYLQLTLNSLRDQLAGLRVVDQTTLLSHIGQTQGANLQQLGVAFQGGGPSTPTTSAFSLAPGTTAYSSTGTPTATTPGTTTSTTPLAAANPSPTTTTLTLPTIGQSSLDTLNESMQLSSEITGYQLLLNGALSDRQSSQGEPRTTFTIGFPVTISPPGEGEEEKMVDSIAEVRVAICGAQDPSIVTLLPQQRTYNVASLVDHSLAASLGAVLGGVFSVGGGFLWHHQSYYLVQQQETVALQLPNGTCASGLLTPTAFTWQIHPVLGKKFVRPGTEYNFVQVSIPYPLNMRGAKIADACIQVGWRRTHDHGNRLDNDVTDAQSRCFEIKSYSNNPIVQALSVSDIGQGNVWVKATGTFLSGTGIRIGNKVLTAGAVGLSSDERSLWFSATAADLATAGGATLLSRESDEIPMLDPQLPYPSGAAAPPAPTPLKINNVQIQPYSATQSVVTVTYTKPTGSTLPLEPCVIPGAVNPPPCIPGDPYLVKIGTKLYGLADTPYLLLGATQIQFLAANDVIAAAPELELMRLLWPPQYYHDKFSLNKDAVTVGKATLLATAPVLRFSVNGTNLDHARLFYPDCSSCYTWTDRSFATITLTTGKGATGLDTAGLKALKQVILCKDGVSIPCAVGFPPILVAIPSDESDAGKTTKPKLEKHDPIALGTREITIKGSGIDQIASIRIEGNVIPYHLSPDKEPALIVELPLKVAANKGQYPLWIELADRSTMSYLINIGGAEK